MQSLQNNECKCQFTVFFFSYFILFFTLVSHHVHFELTVSARVVITELAFVRPDVCKAKLSMNATKATCSLKWKTMLSNTVYSQI